MASPNGAEYKSQGRSPWKRCSSVWKPCKGEITTDSDRIFRPFRALIFFLLSVPGRCPGLSYDAPSGLVAVKSKVGSHFH